jgi:hypothetical protein
MEIGHINVYGIKAIKVGEKAVWRKIRDRWVKYVGEEAKGGKSELEMHDYLKGMYISMKPQPVNAKEFKILHRYEIGIHGDTIHVKRNE